MRAMSVVSASGPVHILEASAESGPVQEVSIHKADTLQRGYADVDVLDSSIDYSRR